MTYIVTGILLLLSTTIVVIVVRRNDIATIHIGLDGVTITFRKDAH